jgi:hypothetical protein
MRNFADGLLAETIFEFVSVRPFATAKISPAPIAWVFAWSLWQTAGSLAHNLPHLPSVTKRKRQSNSATLVWNQHPN